VRRRRRPVSLRGKNLQESGVLVLLFITRRYQIGQGVSGVGWCTGIIGGVVESVKALWHRDGVLLFSGVQESILYL
jgi:hypothetical protein